MEHWTENESAFSEHPGVRVPTSDGMDSETTKRQKNMCMITFFDLWFSVAPISVQFSCESKYFECLYFHNVKLLSWTLQYDPGLRHNLICNLCATDCYNLHWFALWEYHKKPYGNVVSRKSNSCLEGSRFTQSGLFSHALHIWACACFNLQRPTVAKLLDLFKAVQSNIFFTYTSSSVPYMYHSNTFGTKNIINLNVPASQNTQHGHYYYRWLLWITFSQVGSVILNIIFLNKIN